MQGGSVKVKALQLSLEDLRQGWLRSRLSSSLTLAAMSLGYGVVQLDITIVNTALSSIGAALGGGVSGLQWVVSCYTISRGTVVDASLCE